MPNGTYGGVRGRKTKVGRKLLRFPPTRFLRGLEGGAFPSARDGVRHLRQMGFAISGRCQKGSAADGRGYLRQMSEHGCLRGVKEGAGGVYGDLFLKFLGSFYGYSNYPS